MRIALSYCSLRNFTFSYCGLPIVLFCFLWLRPLIGVIAAGTFVAAFVLLSRDNKEMWPSPLNLTIRAFRKRDTQKSDSIEHAVVEVGILALLLMVLVSLTWCILGGQGGLWYQSGDWDARNALFRDLVTHRWPVRYAVDGGWLCYYIAHWLPAALVGKVVNLFGFGNGLTWTIANIALLLWTAFGMVLVFLHIIVAARARTKLKLAICVALPILFATPDVVGIALSGGYNKAFETLHLEWWAKNMQFSSLTTCLFWVFNQSVIPWLCTLCFINEDTFSGYLPIWACCLFTGPFPAVGLAFLMLGYGVFTLVKEGDRIKVVQSVFSISNLFALPVIVILGLYYMTNGASAADAGGAWTNATLLPPPLYFPSVQPDIIIALFFVVAEALLIPLALRLCGVGGPLLLLSTVLLLLCPWIRTSQPADFCMRVSIPAIMCLCLLCAIVCMDASYARTDKTRLAPTLFLVVLLVLGAVTPAFEFYRGFDSVSRKGIVASINDPFVTFENVDIFKKKNMWPRTNYVTQPNQSDSLFFKYIAQK